MHAGCPDTKGELFSLGGPCKRGWHCAAWAAHARNLLHAGWAAACWGASMKWPGWPRRSAPTLLLLPWRRSDNPGKKA